ncbi:MAG: dTDP-4-dehydrorhamnose 3,5-epimerase [Bacteroidetes bacterium]|jgi:dTDP-4-dehydrorhamnose 3,5-epimerase|nr:dTDP-4-dehydrorhamnose 3,5-epimerase [Bacteroidota bacterium]
MQIVEQALNGLCVLKTNVYKDNRGYFLESYHQDKMKTVGIEKTFMQDNFSLSANNVLRGLHFQNPPYAQGKLVKVVSGAVLDVAVDIRPQSPTFGKNFTIQLNQDEHLMLWIPEGFAHGFVSLADNTLFYYKCSNIYNQQMESGIRYDDPDLNINWGVKNPVLSEKDLLLPYFKNATILF